MFLLISGKSSYCRTLCWNSDDVTGTKPMLKRIKGKRLIQFEDKEGEYLEIPYFSPMHLSGAHKSGANLHQLREYSLALVSTTDSGH